MVEGSLLYPFMKPSCQSLSRYVSGSAMPVSARAGTVRTDSMASKAKTMLKASFRHLLRANRNCGVGTMVKYFVCGCAHNLRVYRRSLPHRKKAKKKKLCEQTQASGQRESKKSPRTLFFSVSRADAAMLVWRRAEAHGHAQEGQQAQVKRPAGLTSPRHPDPSGRDAL